MSKNFGDADTSETPESMENKKTKKRIKKNVMEKPIKRKYSKRVLLSPKKASRSKSGFVTIEVPAELAFQIGFTLGHESSVKK